MRIYRLAQLLEQKYRLQSIAGPLDQQVSDIRQALLDAYNNYVNIDSKDLKPAYNIIPLLSEQGERFSRQIIALMEDLINNIDTPDLHDLFSKVQNVLAVINELQEGKKKELKDSIDKIFPVRRETDRNRRGIAKSKFENVVFKKLASILKKQADAINKLIAANYQVIGGPSEPEVREPTKEEQKVFRRTQLAAKHHLDNDKVFSAVWTDPALKRRLIRLINKGKNRWATLEKDPAVYAEAASIIEALRHKLTNAEQFEKPESTFAPENLFEHEEEPEHFIEGDPERAHPSVLDPTEITRKQEQVRKEDEERAKRQQDWESKMVSKYNSVSLQRFLRKVSQ